MRRTQVLAGVAGAMLLGFVGILWAAGEVDFLAWRPVDWTALAAWVTAAVAGAAGIVGLRQLGEARRLRVEQAQPYVVAYMEPSAADPLIIDLVLRNFGTTAATDVQVQNSARAAAQ